MSLICSYGMLLSWDIVCFSSASVAGLLDRGNVTLSLILQGCEGKVSQSPFSSHLLYLQTHLSRFQITSTRLIGSLASSSPPANLFHCCENQDIAAMNVVMG
jgi:hypothetical protein